MRGALFGDIVGSIYEFDNHRSKDFNLVSEDCFATDDSIMSLCVGVALAETYDADLDGWDYDKLADHARAWMQQVGKRYPWCGYGGRFYDWIMRRSKKPYGSYGNGAAMRVGACGEVARSIEEAEQLAEAVTRVSHDHPEGIKGAKAVAALIYMAKTKCCSVAEMMDAMQVYYPNYRFLDDGFKVKDLQKTYTFNETCQETVPQAFECFFESVSFEDAIRNAISIGGDSDTIAAIVGSVAEAYYGVDAIPQKDIITVALADADDKAGFGDTVLTLMLELYDRFDATLKERSLVK